MSQGANRFIVDIQPGATAEETAQRCVEQLQRLVTFINQAKIPIVIGPDDVFPDGMLPGQPVIDWRTGTSQTKVWNGTNLV